MNWIDQIGNVLQHYTGAATGAASAPSDVHEHIDQVAQVAPKSAVAQGLADAFRSDQTPPFDQMISNLFSHSDGQQRAGILNRLLAATGPGILSQLPGLGGLLSGGQQFTPQQAESVPLETVQQMASQSRAEKTFDTAAVSWDEQRKCWVIRLRVGEEVIERRARNVARDANDEVLHSPAVKTANDEGYELDPTSVTVTR